MYANDSRSGDEKNSSKSVSIEFHQETTFIVQNIRRIKQTTSPLKAKFLGVHKEFEYGVIQLDQSNRLTPGQRIRHRKRL